MGVSVRRHYYVGIALLALTGAAALLLGLPWGLYVAAAAIVGLVLLSVYVLTHYVGAASNPTDLETLSASFDTTLRISEETLPYLKQGLNHESAQKITEIMRKITEVDAVAITDTREVLGFSGVGCRRHRQGGPILTGATRGVLQSGHPVIVTDSTILSCDEIDCPHPLKTAIIAPLRFRDQVVGTFKLYRTSTQPLPQHIARLAIGISNLLGIQMELGEADRHRELVSKARLEALQAQIRPHFLFNVLNTVIHFSRTDPEKTRELLIQLASFFRQSLRYRGSFITLQDEVEYINTYLSLEQARYGNLLQVKMKIDPKVLGLTIPILTIQPLVENSVVHGIAPKEQGGQIGLVIRKCRFGIQILVCDNGVGMDKETLNRVLNEGYSTGMGLGLSNVRDRLRSLYGDACRIRIHSSPGQGTAILVRIPVGRQEGEGGSEGIDR